MSPDAGDAALTVVRVDEQDWRTHRDLRLEMLLDAPEAFWSRHGDLVDKSESFWRSSLDRGTSLQARGGDGIPLGTLTVMPVQPAEGSAEEFGPADVLVLAVYVRPQARGRGVGDALLRSAEQVGRGEFAAERLVLHVSELNAPALALYARHGYRPTGRSIAHPRLEGVRELELARPLT